MKKMNFFALGLTSILLISGCGNNAETKENTPNQETASSEVDNVSFDSIVKEMKGNMGADNIDSVFSSEEPVAFGNTEITYNLENYQLYTISNFNEDYSIPFGDQTDTGGVILAKYTLENNSTDSVFIMPSPALEVTGISRQVSANLLSALPDSVDDINSLFVENQYELKAGEAVEGFSAYAVSPEIMEKINEYGVVTALVPTVYATAEMSYTDVIIEDTKVQLPMTESGAESVSAQGEFYQDLASVDNMGTKTMIREEKNVNQIVSQSDIDVTLEGYQFVDFEPNEDTESRFSNFDTGIVLLTTKFTIKNSGDDTISLSSSSSTLYMNNSKLWTLNEGTLAKYTSTNDVVKKGEEKEFLQVYVFDKESFDALYDGKDFELELALRGEDSSQLAKGEDFTFNFK